MTLEELESLDAVALYDRGRALVDQGEFDEGLVFLVASDASGWSSPFAHERHGRVLLEKVHAAFEAAGGIGGIDPDHPSARYRLANRLLFAEGLFASGCRHPEGDLDRALERARARVAASSDDWPARVELACVTILACSSEEAAIAVERLRARPRRYQAIDVDRMLAWVQMLDAEDPWEVLTLEDEGAWREAGFVAYEVPLWRSQLDTAADAVAWCDAGFGWRSLAPWASAGFGAQEARAWQDERFVPGQAAQWRSTEMEPATAAQWRKVRASPEDAVAWRDVGYVPRDFFRLARNVAHHCSLDEALMWREAGIELEEILEWYARGVTSPEQAIELRASGRGV